MRSVVLFLAGDVMLGRGVDQLFPHRSVPILREPYIRDARDYVELAERVGGSIARPVDLLYPWGDALEEFAHVAPDARIINLETSVTDSEEFWPEKDIHYRMHPENVASLTAAGIDVCVLANNHVLDFGHPGLLETLSVLRAAGLKTAGAGRDREEAETPARLELTPKTGLCLYGFGTESSGVPFEWGATDQCPGVALLSGSIESRAGEVAARIAREKRPGEIVVVSIHWGTNWGYAVPSEHVELAHRLIDSGVDLVHGHSSHHPRPIEVYQGRLVLYGCGDLIDDYEGISGHEKYRGELKLMYFASVDARGALTGLRMVPMMPRALRLTRASAEDARWLEAALNRASASFGVRFEAGEDASLRLRWGS